MVSGMFLPADKFTNVTIDNGKVVSDGNREMVAGIAMPGLKESLDMPEDIAKEITIPEGFTMEADVTECEMDPVFTMAVTDMFENLDLGEVSGLDDLKEALEDLNEASLKLVDGTKKLSDGTETLDEKYQEFYDGIATLCSGVSELDNGATKLDNGADKLNSGAQELNKGAETLSSGVSAYTSGADALSSGVKQFTGGVSTLDEKMGEYVQGMNTLKKVWKLMCPEEMHLQAGLQIM